MVGRWYCCCAHPGRSHSSPSHQKGRIFSRSHYKQRPPTAPIARMPHRRQPQKPLPPPPRENRMRAPAWRAALLRYWLSFLHCWLHRWLPGCLVCCIIGGNFALLAALLHCWRHYCIVGGIIGVIFALLCAFLHYWLHIWWQCYLLA